MLSIRVYSLPVLDVGAAEGLAAQIRALPGVHEVLVWAAECTARLEVDSAGFDEHNVLKLIEGKI